MKSKLAASSAPAPKQTLPINPSKKINQTLLHPLLTPQIFFCVFLRHDTIYMTGIWMERNWTKRTDGFEWDVQNVSTTNAIFCTVRTWPSCSVCLWPTYYVMCLTTQNVYLCGITSLTRFYLFIVSMISPVTSINGNMWWSLCTTYR